MVGVRKHYRQNESKKNRQQSTYLEIKKQLLLVHVLQLYPRGRIADIEWPLLSVLNDDKPTFRARIEPPAPIAAKDSVVDDDNDDDGGWGGGGNNGGRGNALIKSWFDTPSDPAVIGIFWYEDMLERGDRSVDPIRWSISKGTCEFPVLLGLLIVSKGFGRDSNLSPLYLSATPGANSPTGRILT